MIHRVQSECVLISTWREHVAEATDGGREGREVDYLNAMDYAEEAQNQSWIAASLERGEEGQRVREKMNGIVIITNTQQRPTQQRTYRSDDTRATTPLMRSSTTQPYNSPPDGVGRQQRDRSPIRRRRSIRRGKLNSYRG